MLASPFGRGGGCAVGEGSDGLRTYKKVGSTVHEYEYSGGKLFYEKRGDNQFYYRYDALGNLATITRIKADGEIFNGYVICNSRGDVEEIRYSTGEPYARYVYDSWGNTIAVYDANGQIVNSETHLAVQNPIRYRGYYWDSETKLYYLQSRYYDPVVGRFISADSQIAGVGGDVLGYNLYAYCQNNPVNLSDEGGAWPKWVSGALNVVSGLSQMAAGAALGAVAGWTGIGAVAAGFLYANGAATATQGVSQIVNHVAKANVLREDNLLHTAAKNVGRAIGGETGAKIAGGVYNTAAIAANVYAGVKINTPSACFIAGTAILTSFGVKVIEEIESGDLVWATNPETGETELKKVVQTFVNETDELVYVKVNGEEIVTTPEHPFYVSNHGWVGAIELRAGDKLVLVNGEFAVIENVQHEILEQPIKVYNFEVEDFHTYYVGDTGVLVHNTCERIGKQIGKAPRSNEAQNKQFRSIVKQFGLNKEEARELHDAISGLGLSRDEIIEEAISLFPNKK